MNEIQLPWVAAIFVAGTIGNGYLTWWRGNTNAENIKEHEKQIQRMRRWMAVANEKFKHLGQEPINMEDEE